jgi:methionyl-tRNA formyltransferase
VIICIAGKNDISVEILLYLLSKSVSREDILVIPNRTDKGKDSWQRSLLKKANQLNIKVATLSDAYHIDDLLFLSLEFDKIIDPLKFKTKQLFNIHFSLLPKYKGMFTSIMPILNNEKFTGVTFHKIDKGVDTGDIIEQVEFPIEAMDNSRDVYHKYTINGVSLVKKCIDKLLKNDHLESQPQNFTESTYCSKKEIDFTNITIDLNQTAQNIHNQIRAFNFREYQVPEIFNTDIVSSKVLKSSSKLHPGEIILENEISFIISTIDNDLILYKDKFNELLQSCKTNSHEIVARLIQIPKIINTQDKNGWTPLIVAIYNNSKETVKILLASDASLSICNFKGTTPLMYAKSSFSIYNDSEIINLLLDFGVDLYKEDYSGKNVLDYCMKNDEMGVLDIITRHL